MAALLDDTLAGPVARHDDVAAGCSTTSWPASV
jgi:hypothetical protein